MCSKRKLCVGEDLGYGHGIMKILLLSPLAPCSGNATTICRIRSHFEKHSFSCELASPESFGNQHEFSEYIHQQCFHLILAIHAYKSGILLAGCQLPYILVLGGTDVNQCSEDPDKMTVMTEAISNAKHVVCFGSSLMEKFSEKWPHHKMENISIIPQAVDTNPSTFNIKQFIENNLQLNDGPPHYITVPRITPITTSHDVWNIIKDKCHNQGSIDTLNESPDVKNCSHKDDSQKKRNPMSQSDEALFGSHVDYKKSHDSLKPHDRESQTPNSYSHISNFAQDSYATLPTDCDDINSHRSITDSSIFSKYVHHTKFTLDQNYVCKLMPTGIKFPQILKPHAHAHDKVDDALFFTLVGGIRPVKDPLYLVEEFSGWARTKTAHCYLLIIGPKMDDGYFKYFTGKISRHSHVIYIPGLSLENTHAVIRDSFAVVNSSLSEGMAISILEAMHLRTPVIVRDIPGNRNIVKHGVTGLIFNTVQDFFTQANKLMDDRKEVAKLTSNAYSYILRNHAIQKEEDDYIEIAQRYL